MKNHSKVSRASKRSLFSKVSILQSNRTKNYGLRDY